VKEAEFKLPQDHGGPLFAVALLMRCLIKNHQTLSLPEFVEFFEQAGLINSLSKLETP
jgi:hypothetical protein